MNDACSCKQKSQYIGGLGVIFFWFCGVKRCASKKVCLKVICVCASYFFKDNLDNTPHKMIYSYNYQV